MRHLNTLIKLAKDSDGVSGQRHSAILTYNRKILVKGVNSYKTHPMAVAFNGEHRPFLCAEKSVMLTAARHFPPKMIEKCELFVLRLDSNDNPAYSKLCKGCREMAQYFGIKKIRWTNGQV